jgi:hypothetical protein
MNFNPKTAITKKNILYSVIILVIICVSILGFFRIRGYLDRRGVIVETINKNTEIYNFSTEKSREILLNLRDFLDFSNSEPAKVDENIKNLNSELPKIQELSKSIDKDLKELETKDRDAQELVTAYSEGLASKQATLNLLNEFVSYEVCIVENSSKQFQNVTAFSQTLGTFSSNPQATIEEKRKNIADSILKINENIELLPKIENCFVGNYRKYFTEDVKKLVKTDQDLYQKYSTSIKLIDEGLGNNDSSKLQEGTNQLLQLKDQNPTFFSSEAFRKALEDPKKLIQEQALILEKQEKKIQEKLDNLKGKYQID